jgi:hypothetical protein
MVRKKARPPAEEEQLKAKRELFCRYYTQNQELFGNATLSYAEAFDYDLDALSRKAVYAEVIDEETGETSEGALIDDSPYDKAYHVCSVLSSRLLRNVEIQARITVLLNELLKDEVVDSQLAKLVMQNGDNTNKIAAIREFNKLRGRIIDRTQQVNRLPFGETDLSLVLATLPQERQDYFYGIIRDIIEEAELLRSAGAAEGSGTR